MRGARAWRWVPRSLAKHIQTFLPLKLHFVGYNRKFHALGPDGEVVVAGGFRNDCVKVFDRFGTLLRRVGDDAPHPFNLIQQVVVTDGAVRCIVVLDYACHVQVFDYQGHFLHSLQSPRLSAMDQWHPASVAAIGDEVFVTNEFVIYVFAVGDGRLLRQWVSRIWCLSLCSIPGSTDLLMASDDGQIKRISGLNGRVKQHWRDYDNERFRVRVRGLSVHQDHVLVTNCDERSIWLRRLADGVVLQTWKFNQVPMRATFMREPPGLINVGYTCGVVDGYFSVTPLYIVHV